MSSLSTDRRWAKELLDTVFVRWSESAATPNGIFDPYLDRNWSHHTDGPRTLVSQCRLIYNFACAYEMTGEATYRNLMAQGIAALERFFRSNENGRRGWIWACDGDGSVVSDVYDTYGHAFVILALSTAASVDSNAEYRALAAETWQFVDSFLRDDQDGFVWHVDSQGVAIDTVRSQNPLMHMFEALLALHSIDPGIGAEHDALRIWDFLQSKMPAPACLPEWFDEAWVPIASGPQALVEVGHAAEWGFLLSEAAGCFKKPSLVEQGRRMLDYGLRVGHDQGAGGIYSQVDYDGKVIGPRKGWWEQCELIRALARFVSQHDSTELGPDLEQSIAFVRAHFVDTEMGGWYECPPGTGGSTSLLKGHSYKLDYHVVNMCRELLRDTQLP